MRGSVVKKQRKSGVTYYAVVDIGKDAAGKRKQKWHGPFRTRTEASRALSDIVGRVHQGAYVEPTKATLAEFLTDQWLPGVKPTLRLGTWRGYERLVVTRIIPRIGHIGLQRLTPADLSSFYSNLLEDGGHNGRPLSPKSVRNTHAILRHALGDALKWGLLTRNVALAADPPRVDSAAATMSTWTGAEVRSFLGHVADDRLSAMWMFFLTTGVRRGEAVGLRWESVDLDTGRVTIRHARVLAGSYEVVTEEPKTAKGRRSITLDASTVTALREHRTRQLQDRLAAGPAWIDSGLVFVHEDGTPLHPDGVSQRWERLVASSNLPRIRLHDARHTHATICLAAGVNPRVVADRLGHSDVALTLRIYSHVTESMEADAAEKVAGAIFGASV